MTASRSEAVKKLALEAGFDIVGIAPVDRPDHLEFFPGWVERGYAGEMGYLANQVDRRADVRTAFSWARSLVVVGLQYDTAQPYSIDAPDDRGWVSRYAWGDDYHDVMTKMLDRLAEQIEERLGPMRSRRYVDTGPIVERAYAAAAGLGAWGKNTCLLHPEHGSWFFIGELVTDLELSGDAPRTDMCGSCTACLDSCPTSAFREPFVLDATRCISYLTIEIKGSVPEELREGIGRHVFGCDICQDVCPWNRKRRHTASDVFEARDGLAAPELGTLAELDADAFRERFRNSPIKRAKRRGLLRNVCVAIGNAGDPEHREVLERLSNDEDAVIREHADWALARVPGEARES